MFLGVKKKVTIFLQFTRRHGNVLTLMVLKSKIELI